MGSGSNGDGYDLFIAHASEDLAHAQVLYDAISPPHRVFLDKNCLLAGGQWPKELEAALRGSRFIAVLLSAKHDKYYVREEICIALHEQNNSKGQKKVIPVILPDWQNHTPYGLNQLQRLDARALGGVKPVAGRLADLINGGSTAQKLEKGDPPGPVPVPVPEHPLRIYPRGPAVFGELIPVNIPDAYADYILEPHERRRALEKAVQYRVRADKDDESVTYPRPADLPPSSASSKEFWISLFHNAGLHGPRMLAALIEVLDAEMLPKKVRQEREELLKYLPNHQ